VLTRAQKQEQVSALREKLARATCVYVADYRGVDVQSVNRLRSRIRNEGNGDYEYAVVKNTVLRRAAAESPVEGISDRFAGPTAVALSYGDPVGLAKILVDFTKDVGVFELKGGLVDGQPVGSPEIGTLATLPGLDELRGRLVGIIQAPATKIARVLSEPGAQIARVLAARGRQES
jgi:large subunit ribosomal protein L10